MTATGLLLLLGEPGSGKTTTLLDLARILLERAGKDIRERLPIVLNLSSWKKKQPLVEWVSSELSEKYRVPRKIARSWLQNHYLLLLLDGLDEVQTTLQPDCVAAVNAFIRESYPSGLVVCCRLNEYRWLPERLKLNAAICLEPLIADEIEKYLVGGGPKLATLREAVHTDSVLQELAQTPLMLSIMSLTFQGASTDELAAQKGESTEERRKQIFRLYIEEMFKRKGASSEFPKEKTIGWLSWLAEKMREHSQSVFFVEGLQPSWLGTRAKRVAYGTIVALNLGLTIGLIAWLIFGLGNDLIAGLTVGLIIFVAVAAGCWSESPLKNGLISGSIGGLIIGLIAGLIARLQSGLIIGLIAGLISLGVGSMNHISLVETMSWKWSHFWKRTIPRLIYGLIVGVLVGGLTCGLRLPSLRYSFSDGAIGGLFGGLIGAVIVGLVSSLIGGFTDSVKVGKTSPNQGIKLSLKNSSTVFLVIGVMVALVFSPIAGLMVGLKSGLIIWLIAGLIGGLIAALNRGGSAVIKHYVLRLTLWRSGYTPLNFVAFLDQRAKLILLKKVGGGYIFIHRMLLDYFAELTPESIRTTDSK
jgi:hypothetical protein